MALSLTTIRNSILTSIHGRRLGLDKNDCLVGPRGVVLEIEDLTTAPTTLSNYGIARIPAGFTSTQGVVQHFLPVPIPGVEKIIINQSTSTGSQQFLSTANGASINISSLGSTGGVVNIVGPGGRVHLVGLTTASWGVINEGAYTSTALAKAVTFTTST